MLNLYNIKTENVNPSCVLASYFIDLLLCLNVMLLDDNSRESTDSVQIQEIQAGRNLEQSTSGVQRHGQGRASKKQGILYSLAMTSIIKREK